MSTKMPRPVDLHVGARIRMRRLMLGMSQEKLAEGLGLTFQQVQKYEKGTNRVGSSRMVQIAEILQTPVAWFFEGTEKVHSSAVSDPLQAVFQTREGIRLVTAFLKLKDQKVRANFVALGESLADPIPGENAVGERDRMLGGRHKAVRLETFGRVPP